MRVMCRVVNQNKRGLTKVKPGLKFKIYDNLIVDSERVTKMYRFVNNKLIPCERHFSKS